MLVHYKSELLFAIAKGWNKDGIEWVQDYDSDNQQPTLEEMLFMWMVVPDCLIKMWNEWSVFCYRAFGYPSLGYTS